MARRTKRGFSALRERGFSRLKIVAGPIRCTHCCSPFSWWMRAAMRSSLKLLGENSHRLCGSRLGNSMAVPCMAWLGTRIQMVSMPP
jgi:hypothetical protein